MSERKTIDAHAILGEEYHLKLDAAELLRRMDAHGIAQAIARPSGAELAVYNRAGNDRVLGAGPRIFGMATVNPWFGTAAIDELERCRDLGAVGLYLHPTRQGFMPTDELVRPIVDWAAEAGWPITFHTGSYVQSDVLALVELARQYPQVAFIAGFGGFTDMWFELPGAFAERDNLYLDASMMWEDAIAGTIKAVGAGRVLFGSAEPRGRYAVILKLMDRLALPPEHEQAVLSENARRIFHLP